MSRFRQAGDEVMPYSDLHPERFVDPQAYVTPKAAAKRGEVRAIDDAPELEPMLPLVAYRGYAHLKGTR